MPNNPNAVDNLTPFKPGESGNPNGRPRKMVSQVIEDLGEAGIEHVTKQQVQGAIEALLNCQRQDLIKYAEDESHSILIRIVARHMIKAGDSDRVFNWLLDRAFGKPEQKTELSGKVSLFDALTEEHESDNKKE